MLLGDGEIPPEAKTRNVTIMKDTGLEYPSLHMSIYVESDSRYEHAQFAEFFVRSDCTKAETPDDADLVVFTGGVDVDPRLYGAKPYHTTDQPNEERDTREINLYLYCMERGIPMFGVCRGAQFLWVMNGGKLYQDINNHNGEHPMFDLKGKLFIDRVSSVHHQACMPNIVAGTKVPAEILAESSKATMRWKEPSKPRHGVNADIEAFWIRDTVCLGVQGHPEYRNYSHYSRWCLQQIEECIMYNPDVTGTSGKYRVKPDLLSSRGLGRPESLEPDGVPPEAEPTPEVVVEGPGPQQEV